MGWANASTRCLEFITRRILHAKNYGVTTHYLNGLEYRPIVQKSGWLYDSTHHKTIDTGCS